MSAGREFEQKLKQRLDRASHWLLIPGGKGPGWFDRNFEWRRFFTNQVFTRATFAHQDVNDYLGYTGVMAVCLLLVQMATGLLLLLYYVPDPDLAFASHQVIRNEVPFGHLISNLHSINASLLILVLLIHMFRIMLISAHRGPREVQWYSGALLLLLMLVTGFSGYLLPWSQQSYWACVIGTEAARAAPVIGDGLVQLLRGGDNVTGATLHRFFALHVSVLPVVIILLGWLHVKRVWKTGVIAPAEMRAVVREHECIGCGRCERVCQFGAVTLLKRKDDVKSRPVINPDRCNACRTCVRECPVECIRLESDAGPPALEPLWPDHAVNRAKGVLLILIVLFIGAFFLPGLLMRVKEPANPMLTPDAIKPEWYFLAAYQVLREMPNELAGLLALAAVSILVFFLPALDRQGPRAPRRRPVYLTLVIAGIVGFVALTIRGLL